VPPAPACAWTGPPSPEVTGAFCRVPSTPFSHTPWYALPVHQCRFRVRSMRRRCFPEVPGRPLNPVRGNGFRPSSRSGRRRNVNPLPIGYGFRPRLRGPANPARINLAQEPLDFRREGFSPSFTLLMSAFALPMPPQTLARLLRRPTERSATTPEDRDQRSEVRTAAIESGEHPGNLPIRAPPTLGHIAVDIAEIATIKRPYLHLIGRSQRHHHKPAKLRL
jgi:hypothetical protein